MNPLHAQTQAHAPAPSYTLDASEKFHIWVLAVSAAKLSSEDPVVAIDASAAAAASAEEVPRVSTPVLAEAHFDDEGPIFDTGEPLSAALPSVEAEAVPMDMGGPREDHQKSVETLRAACDSMQRENWLSLSVSDRAYLLVR